MSVQTGGYGERECKTLSLLLRQLFLQDDECALKLRLHADGFVALGALMLELSPRHCDAAYCVTWHRVLYAESLVTLCVLRQFGATTDHGG